MDSATPLQDLMLEFRAGKMFFEGTRVIPDARKGLVRIGRGDEGLIHFQWLDRTQNIVEDDQIIFPEEAVFEKVTQSSGRVYILKFSSDDRKFFFWMQESRAEGDRDLCSLVNNCLNRTLDIMGEDEDVSVPVPEVSEDTADDDLSSRAGNLVDQSMTTDLTGEVTSSAGSVRLEDLQRILRSIQTPVEDPDARIGLADILKPDLVSPLIETLPVEQRLASYLPEGSQSPADIIELIQSPPFRQQLETFTHVLRTGQIDLSQFGIDPTKYKFTVISFLEALEDSVANASTSGSNAMQDEKRNDPMDES